MSATGVATSFFSTLLERCHTTLIILIIDLVLNANLQEIMLHKTKIHSALFKWSPATFDGPQSVSKIEQSLVIFNLALPTTNSNLDTLQ
jgi:uncharacterized membrane protein